jgi:CRISPR-associated endonuclease Csn1
MNISKLVFGTTAPVTKLSSTFPKKVDEDLSLGLDIGVGSCGQALIQWSKTGHSSVGQLPPFSGPIAFLGVRAFDVPERGKMSGGVKIVKLKNPERRSARLMRRTIRRRSQRMQKVRRLLKEAGILPPDYSLENDTWRKLHEKATPLLWRAEALDRKISDWEFSSILMHLAKHRGFKSNRKSDLLSDAKGKEGGTLDSTKSNHELLKKYRSVGEMCLLDEKFKDRQRNREGSYTTTILRDDLRAEATLIFTTQRNLGNSLATIELERNFIRIFSEQNPLQDPIHLLGDCPFEKGEKRAAQRSYSFELSRALQKLNTLTLQLKDGSKVRLSEHVNAAQGGYDFFIRTFGTEKNISWKNLRDFFQLDQDTHFLDLPSAEAKKGKNKKDTNTSPKNDRDQQEKLNFATRSNKNTSALGSYLLYKALGQETWDKLIQNDVASLDHAAFCLSFFEALDSQGTQTGVFDAMRLRGVDDSVIEKLRVAACEGKLAINEFSGAVSLSSKACRALNIHLARGLVYTEACEKAGYQPHDQNFSLENIVNPVVQSVVREVLKQVVHLIDQTGALPGSICVEMARDMGKSIAERNEISKALEERTKNKNANRDAFAKYLSKDPSQISEDELERYELWLEQAGWCPYSGNKLPPPERICSSDLEVDHILPRSRSHDNSYDNKVLVYTDTNRNKGSQTPFEWLGKNENSEVWRSFVGKIYATPSLRKRKRLRLLNTDFSEKEPEFLSRNLQDTRYICRLVRAYLEDLYRMAGEEPSAKGSMRRVFVQPGGLTALVRRAWGLEDLKKDLGGKRLGDKHHAVDALICAALSEGQRQLITQLEQRKSPAAKKVPYHAVDALTRSYALMEEQGNSRKTPRGLLTPWGEANDFRNSVISALESLTVSRRESRRGRGSLHNDTFYREVLSEDSKGKETKKYYKRTSLIQLVNGKATACSFALSDVKDIDTPRNHWLKKALEEWDRKKRPTDALPKCGQATIRKVWIEKETNSARQTPHGMVVHGDQVRLDIFRKGPKFYLVPVYAYQIRQDQPPMRAIAAAKPEKDWDIIDASFEFCFSLWPNSIFEISKKATKKKKGAVIRGYYSGVNRRGGKIEGYDFNDKEIKVFASPKQGCLSFKKLAIDRLGRLYTIKGEKRTWRGAVCT